MLCLVLLPRFQWINLGHQEFQGNGRVALWYRAKISRLNNIMALLLRHGLVDLGQSWASILLFWHPHDMLNTSIIHRKNGKSSWKRHSLRPTCRTTIGSASSCCSQRLRFCRMMSVLGHCYCFFLLHFSAVLHTVGRPETWRGGSTLLLLPKFW